MTSDCDICKAVTQNKGVLYRDEKVAVLLDSQPAAKGQIICTTIEHLPIIENVDKETVEHLFKVVNKMSVILFEALSVQGTNILVNNGVTGGQDREHFVVNIIPRTEGDGLDFSWKTEQASPDVLNDMESKLMPAVTNMTKENADVSVPQTAAPEPEETRQETSTQEPKPTHDNEEEDYRIAQLRRIP